MNDTVSHPTHYIGKYGLETIDVIRNFTGNMDGFEAYCTGNIIKYICRWRNKNGVEDLKKAKQYLDILIDKLQPLKASYDGESISFTYDDFIDCGAGDHDIEIKGGL